MGFQSSEVEKLVGQLKPLDLSRPSSRSLPANVTRSSSDAEELEGVLREDPSFLRLFSEAGRDMGFRLLGHSGQERSALPDTVVDALLAGKSHVGTSWQAAERQSEFMRDNDSAEWWMAYVLQVAGCGHLMMHHFIQQLLDSVQ